MQQIKAHQLEVASSSKKPRYTFECDLDDNDDNDNDKHLILPQALTLPKKKQKKNWIFFLSTFHTSIFLHHICFLFYNILFYFFV